MEPLNGGHVRILITGSVTDKCPLLGGNLTSYLGLNVLSAIQDMSAIGRFHCIKKDKVYHQEWLAISSRARK